MITVRDVRYIIQNEAQKILLGVVVATDSRLSRTVSVRTSGGRTHTRVRTCVDALQVGDEVLIARIKSLDQPVVIAKVHSVHGSPLSMRSILAPPSNFTALSFPGVCYAQWDRWEGEDLAWEVQRALQGDKSDATTVLKSGGSYYFYETTPGTTVYFRCRAIRWLGDNNVMYSGWSAWVSVVCDDHEIDNLIIELTNKSGGVVEANRVVVIDTGTANSFTTTNTEGDEDVIGVTIEEIADDAIGSVCIYGLVDVYVNNATAIGDYLNTAAAFKMAQGNAALAVGTFGRSLEVGNASTVAAVIGSLAGGGGGGGVAAHDILSVFHSDSVAAAVVQGDVLYGDAAPAWTKLAIAAAYKFLAVNAAGTMPEWQAFVWANIAGVAGANMTHDHSAAGEGGQLDWDDIWSDSVHDHSAAGEGGEVPLTSLGSWADARIMVGGAADWIAAVLSGDATIDNTGALTVTGIQGTPVENVAPTNTDILAYDQASGQWEITDRRAMLHEHAINEDHSGECNGVKTEFIAANEFEPETLQVWLNGSLQRPGAANDFTEGALYDTWDMNAAPIGGDELLVSYLAA